MNTRAPIKKGIDVEGDLTTKEYFTGLDAHNLIYSPRPFPDPTVDTVSYDVPYHGGDFVEVNSFGFMRRGESSYIFDPTGEITITIDEYLRPDSIIDQFSFIDHVYFSDGLLNRAGYTDPSFAVQGLYEYLGRDRPDVAGFRFWLDGYDSGSASLTDLAHAFIDIKAQTALSGGVTPDPGTNRDFVLYLYQTVLERAGEAEGVAFWTGNLDQGLASRAEVLGEFVDVNGETAWYNAQTLGQPFGGYSWIPLE